MGLGCSRMRLSDLCTLVKIPKPRDSRVPRLVNPPPTIPSIFKVVFHFGCLPFWSSSILVVFHFGRLPFESSSILAVFHFGRLPFWSSSILVVFHFGRLPFWVRSSSILDAH